MILTLVLSAFTAVGSYFAWSYIHEISHVLMAKYLVGLEWYKIKVYPHVDEDAGFRFASVQYMPKRYVEPTEDALISLAPRLAGIIACALAPMFLFWWMLNPTVAAIWLVFWGAGVVDLIVGSLGISKHSDLKQAAVGLNLNPWFLRSLVVTTFPTIYMAILALSFLLGG